MTQDGGTWIDRVRAADQDAEREFQIIFEAHSVEREIKCALDAIAAELRAQRIARRPGAGQ